MSTVKLEMTCGTDPGRVRSRNEDHVRIIPHLGLAILADGMGGHKAGDVASQIAVDTIGEQWDRKYRERGDQTATITGSRRSDELLLAVSAANEQIYTLSKNNPEFQGMGSTVISAHFNRDGLCAVHLGDSRMYRYRRGTLTQMTTDHTHAQESIRLGLISAEDAKGGYGWNLLLKALGVDSVIEPDIIAAPVEVGDIYLMCSDGLTDAVNDSDIRTRIALGEDDLPDTIDELIELANQNGGPDNISVVLVKVIEIDD